MRSPIIGPGDSLQLCDRKATKVESVSCVPRCGVQFMGELEDTEPAQDGDDSGFRAPACSLRRKQSRAATCAGAPSVFPGVPVVALCQNPRRR